MFSTETSVIMLLNPFMIWHIGGLRTRLLSRWRWCCGAVATLSSFSLTKDQGIVIPHIQNPCRVYNVARRRICTKDLDIFMSLYFSAYRQIFLQMTGYTNLCLHKAYLVCFLNFPQDSVITSLPLPIWMVKSDPTLFYSVVIIFWSV